MMQVLVFGHFQKKNKTFMKNFTAFRWKTDREHSHTKNEVYMTIDIFSMTEAM
jgi:hypothetical protein